MSQTIHVFEKWQVKKGQLETVLNLIMEVVRINIETQGNLYFKLHQSHTDLDTLLLFHGYADEVALAEYNKSEYIRKLVEEKITPLLENKEITVSKQLVSGLPGIAPRHCLVLN